MQMYDDQTEELLGHLVDVSQKGFKMDSKKQIPAGRDYRLRMDLIGEISGRPFIVFTARSKWCQTDPMDPFIFNVGFEITGMNQADAAIYKQIVEKYGS